MDNNNFLSFPRIAMVMKREIMENWKTNIFRFIGLYAAFALVMIGNMWGASNNASAFSDPAMFFNRCCSNIMASFVLIVGIASLAYAANIMENMITKEKRISFLMLPATMIEKFVARFLIVTVGFALAVVAATSLAEITHYLVLPLFNVPEEFHQSFLYNLISMASIDGEQVYRGPGSFNMGYNNWLGEAWDKLTEEQQNILMEAGKVASQFNRTISEEAENKVLEELKADGINVVEVPDIKPWQDACKGIIESSTKDQAELYQQILDMNK